MELLDLNKERMPDKQHLYQNSFLYSELMSRVFISPLTNAHFIGLQDQISRAREKKTSVEWSLSFAGVSQVTNTLLQVSWTMQSRQLKQQGQHVTEVKLNGSTSKENLKKKNYIGDSIIDRFQSPMRAWHTTFHEYEQIFKKTSKNAITTKCK